MASTTLLLNGFSVIGDPQTNSNASDGGELMIHGGTALFEDDDIVVFEVENVTEDGVLTDESVITGITVYDNASDYFNDVQKYDYEAEPGGGGDIDFGRNTMGDRYLEFDASSLTSTDPEAPELGEIAVVAGVDVLGTVDSQNGPYVVSTNENLDLDGDGVITPDEASDGSFSDALNIFAEESMICFAAGTLIETPMGPQPIETLRVGDRVNTLDAGPQNIAWIGGSTTQGVGTNAPVWIRRGAMGNVRDLWVSQNHRLLVRGAAAELMFGEPEILVAAKHLVDGRDIQIVARPELEYWHFLLDAHHIVFAEACATESLFPGQETLNSVSVEERDEIIGLFPDLTDQPRDYWMSRYALKAYEARALLHAA
jgi:hypothetical protein